MLMSYLGSIGSVMAGSGLAEVLERCYERNTVQHMLTGKAVSRAIRGHFLIESALSTLLIRLVLSCVDDSNASLDSSPDTLKQADVDNLRSLYDTVANGTFDIADSNVPECLVKLEKKNA
jgi:hypothetical protein